MNVRHSKPRSSARRGWRSGNAIIEMAIVFPILLWLSMGMVEFGQFFYIRSAFVGAARDGCRKATLASSSRTNITDTINTMLRQAINSNPAIDVSSSGSQAGWLKFYDISQITGLPTLVTDPTIIPSGDGVEVALTAQYDLIPGCFRPLYAITGKGIGTGKMITVQTMMVKE